MPHWRGEKRKLHPNKFVHNLSTQPARNDMEFVNVSTEPSSHNLRAAHLDIYFAHFLLPPATAMSIPRVSRNALLELEVIVEVYLTLSSLLNYTHQLAPYHQH